MWRWVRVVLIVIVGIVSTYISYTSLHDTSILFFAFVILLPLALLAIILIIWSVNADLISKKYKEEKHKLKYLATALCLFFLVTTSFFQIQKYYLFNKPNTLCAFYTDNDFLLLQIDFKTDNTFIVKKAGVFKFVSEYSYGKYNISGDTITILGELPSFYLDQRYLITTDSLNQKYILPLDSINNIKLRDYPLLNIIEDNR